MFFDFLRFHEMRGIIQRPQPVFIPKVQALTPATHVSSKKITHNKPKEQSMANEIVSPQITDSVTSTNTMVVAVAPSQIMSNMMQVSAHINGLSMQNAAIGQKQTNMIADASTTQGLSAIYEVDTATEGQAVDTINRSNDMSKIIDALSVTNIPKAEQPNRAYGA